MALESLNDKVKEIDAQQLQTHPNGDIADMVAQVTQDSLEKRSENSKGLARGEDWGKEFAKLVENLANNTIIQAENVFQLKRYSLQARQVVYGAVMNASGDSDVLPPIVAADPRDSNGNIPTMDEIKRNVLQPIEGQATELGDTANNSDVKELANNITAKNVKNYNSGNNQYTSKYERPVDRLADLEEAIKQEDDLSFSSVSLGNTVETKKVSVGSQLDDIGLSEEKVEDIANAASRYEHPNATPKTERAEELWTKLDVDHYTNDPANFDQYPYFEQTVMANKENAEAVAGDPVAMGMIFSADEVAQ